MVRTAFSPASVEKAVFDRCGGLVGSVSAALTTQREANAALTDREDCIDAHSGRNAVFDRWNALGRCGTPVFACV
jgi:hypothetical protein